MKVLKRDGTYEPCHFDTITARLKELCYGLSDSISADVVAQKICMSIYDGIPTSKLDELASEVAMAMVTEHPDYGRLAGRIVVSDLHKQTSGDLVQTFTKMHQHTVKGQPAPLVTDELLQVVVDNAEALHKAVDYDKDYEYDYFGMKTLIRSYLTKMHGKVVERPQTMLMRVSIGLCGTDISAVLETYNLLSEKYYTHATPTLYNAGTPRPQLASCFLAGMKSDSVDGIFDTLKQCANISKYAGGIGLHVHNIRARGSFIKGTNGQSSGILPLLRTVNNVARYIDQGGRRPGSIAVYLSPDHPDFTDFTSAKLPNGSFEERAYDLFYGAYIPDLFMTRVDEDEQWSMFCPSEAPGLADVVGQDYVDLYTRYEKEGRAARTVPARTIWQEILRSQVETGGPYLVYKDACNLKSNQQSKLCMILLTVV
jgi:ribonucleoside-diphosphate reductase subunit M1